MARSFTRKGGRKVSRRRRGGSRRQSTRRQRGGIGSGIGPIIGWPRALPGGIIDMNPTGIVKGVAELGKIGGGRRRRVRRTKGRTHKARRGRKSRKMRSRKSRRGRRGQRGGIGSGPSTGIGFVTQF